MAKVASGWWQVAKNIHVLKLFCRIVFFLPKDMTEEVKEWIKNHRRLQRILKEASKLNMAIIHRHIPESRGGAKKAQETTQTDRSFISDSSIQYFAYVLDAKLVTPCGMALTLATCNLTLSPFFISGDHR